MSYLKLMIIEADTLSHYYRNIYTIYVYAVRWKSSIHTMRLQTQSTSGFCVRRHVATMSTCLDCSTVAAITLSYCRTTNVAHTKNNSPAKTYFTYIHTRTPSLNNSLCHNYRVCPVPWFLLPILQFHSKMVIRSDLRTIQGLLDHD